MKFKQKILMRLKLKIIIFTGLKTYLNLNINKIIIYTWLKKIFIMTFWFKKPVKYTNNSHSHGKKI